MTFSRGKEFRETMRLAVPVCITMLGNMAMGIVDTIVVGRVSATELAGVAAGNSIFWTLVLVTYGLMFGLETLVAQAVGAGREKVADQSLAQGLWLSTAASIVVIPLVILISTYYHLFGAQPEVVEATRPYLDVIVWSFPFLAFFNAFQRYWQAQNIAMPVTIITIIANVINYFADVAFVTGSWGFPEMGAAGVGIATLVCRIFTLIAIIGVSFWYWRERNKSPRREPFLYRELLHIRRPLMKDLILLGLPAGGQMAVEVGSFAFVTNLVAGLGAIDLAAHHIVLTISSAAFMLPLGMSSAAAIRVGHYVGASDSTTAREAGWFLIKLCAFFMFFIGLSIYWGRAAFVSLFSSDASVFALAAHIMIISALFQVFDGVQVVGAGTLRGIGNTKLSFYANVFGHYILGIPLGLWLCYQLEWGLKGLWVGLATGLAGTAIAIVWYWQKSSRHIVGLVTTSPSPH